MATKKKKMVTLHRAIFGTSCGSHCDLWSNYCQAGVEGALQRDEPVPRVMRDILCRLLRDAGMEIKASFPPAGEAGEAPLLWGRGRDSLREGF